MLINSSNEYFAVQEMKRRLTQALDYGRSYMTGEDWNTFSKGINRRLEECSQALLEYSIRHKLDLVAQHFFQINLTIQGIFSIPAATEVFAAATVAVASAQAPSSTVNWNPTIPLVPHVAA